MSYETKVNINVQVDGKEQIRRLSNDLEHSQEECARLASSLERVESELRRATAEYDKFAHASGLDILRNELERFQSTAQQSTEEFRAFLQAVNLNDQWGSNDYMFADLFDGIEKGSLTASQAIMKVKTNFAELLQETHKSGSGMFDAQAIQQFMATLEKMSATLDSVRNKIDYIEKNGISGGSAGGGVGGGNVAETMREIEKAASSMSTEAQEAFGKVTQLVEAMQGYASLDDTKLLGVSQAFRNLADVSAGNFGSKTVDNITRLARELQSISANGGSIRFDFTGLNDLHVGKASLRNLAEFLPQITSVDMSPLERLSKIDFTNLNNLTVRKGTAENLARMVGATAPVDRVSEAIDRLKPAIDIFKDMQEQLRNTVSLVDSLAKSLSGVEGKEGSGGSRKGSSDFTKLDTYAAKYDDVKRKFASITEPSEKLVSSFGRLRSLMSVMESGTTSVEDKASAYRDLSPAINEVVAMLHAEAAAQKDAADAAKAVQNESDYVKSQSDSLEKNLEKLKSYKKALDEARAVLDQNKSGRVAIEGMPDEDRIENIMGGKIADAASQIDRYEAALARLRTAIDSGDVNEIRAAAQAISETGSAAKSASKDLQDIVKGYNGLDEKIAKASTNFARIANHYSKLAIQNEGTASPDIVAHLREQAKAFMDYSQYPEKAREAFINWAKSNNVEISSAGFQKFVSESEASLNRFRADMNITGEATETFAQKIMRTFKDKFFYGVMAQAAMLLRQSFREVITTVKELDTAMVELRKVTNASEAEYDKFFANAGKRAVEYGATMTDTINASADFARLGFNIDDASTLANVAIVYKNVGDGITDISQASESIISTMQAFGIEANNAMSIVDKFNEIGKQNCRAA